MFCCKKNEKKFHFFIKLCSVTFAKIAKTYEVIYGFNINYVLIPQK